MDQHPSGQFSYPTILYLANESRVLVIYTRLYYPWVWSAPPTGLTALGSYNGAALSNQAAAGSQVSAAGSQVSAGSQVPKSGMVVWSADKLEECFATYGMCNVEWVLLASARRLLQPAGKF